VVSVQIIRPSCGKYGKITVSDDILKKAGRGLLAVNIAHKNICKHSFTAYIDKNGEVRDYFTVDFEVSFPEMEEPQKTSESTEIRELGSDNIVDTDLIRLNLPSKVLTYILRCIFSKKRIVLIFDHEFLRDHFLNFFTFITKNSFDTDIIIITRTYYKKHKKEYKNAMVFEGAKIIYNYTNFLDPTKLWIEKMIVNKFLSKQDLGYGYIILKNEIEKAFTLSECFLELMEETEEKGEQGNSLTIASQLEKEFKIKIDNKYLEFLRPILEDYFGKKTPPLTDSFLGMV
jgi:hypothetical protein